MTISFAPVTTSAERERYREADRCQAEYYWRLLAEERAAVRQKLARDELDLAAQRNGCGFVEDRSPRRAIHQTQTELNAIDRLIGALEQRLLTTYGMTGRTVGASKA